MWGLFLQRKALSNRKAEYEITAKDDRQGEDRPFVVLYLADSLEGNGTRLFLLVLPLITVYFCARARLLLECLEGLTLYHPFGC